MEIRNIIFDWSGTAAVLSGYHDEARLRKAEPDHLLKNISELKTILTAQSQTPQYQI